MMQQAFLTVDLGFGDAGKGTVVDYLTRAHDAHTVVRYNGGAQAGHRVVTPAGQEHVFAQFGSGTLAGAATHLSRFMLIEPLAMMAEEEHLRTLGVVDAFQRTTIDEQALVITPFQRAANRLKELARGDRRHGSCGMGVGETMADSLADGDAVVRVGDLTHPDILRARLHTLAVINARKLEPLLASLPQTQQVEDELDVLNSRDWVDWLMVEYARFAAEAQICPRETLHAILQKPGVVVFEGAQGVLLDEWVGFHPYTTWSRTTLANAERLLGEAGYEGKATRLGITRAYTTRHGAGPFASEDPSLSALLPDAANGFGPWQQGFRVGWLDLVMLRYARRVVGRLDALAVTCLDRAARLPLLQVCEAYCCDGTFLGDIAPSPNPHDLADQERLTRCLERCKPFLREMDDVTALLDLLTGRLGVPIVLTSSGPTALEKHDGSFD
jgi:adenylosuccinate synthase